uniref:Uncharacterized protein n=1 Tax=Anguilla anguilla TaxID=7936 RepID=A0A0E9T599_ANGAN
MTTSTSPTGRIYGD